MRPNLDPLNKSLLNAYYLARRESDEGKLCKKMLFLAELESCHIESDLGLKMLQRLDDFYLSLYREKLKRMNK